MPFVQVTLFGLRAQPVPQHSARDQKRAEKRKEIEEATSNDDDNEEDDDKCSPKKKTEVRCNWQQTYNEKFGDWIEKIPYTCLKTGMLLHMAGCVACKENGAVRGLGAHPTKKLKSCTFSDHELTQAHEQVGTSYCFLYTQTSQQKHYSVFGCAGNERKAQEGVGVRGQEVPPSNFARAFGNSTG